MKNLIPLVLAFLASMPLNGQSHLTEHTLQLDAPENSPAATPDNFHWMAGRWLGKGFGGTLEENWNPPMGGTMVATFRLIRNGEVQFYEICTLEPEDGSVIYRVKHFDPGMKGWEEKDEYVAFPLVKLEHHKAYFSGLTIERNGNTITQYLAVKQKDGSYKEHPLVFERSTVTTTSEQHKMMDEFDWKVDKTPILFLGSYHMANPGADQFNLEADDVLTDKRQKEIKALVEQLAEFKPTMIAVESPFMDSVTITDYHNYVKGKHELRRNEEEQIGFRLAKMLGHDSIYPIDTRMQFMPPEFEAAVAAKPAKHGPLMAEMEQTGQKVVTLMGEWLKSGTISDMLYQMNQPEFLAANYQVYLRYFLPIVAEGNYAGADLVSNWHQRNLRIMSNLHKIGFDPEDRILVIFGQGHVPLFQQIAEDSPYFEVVEVLPYLK